MTTPTPELDLEDRLRTGLHAAAGALPPAGEELTLTPATPGRRRSAFPSTAPAPLRPRRWVRTSVAAAATIAAVTGTAVVLTRGSTGDDPAGSISAESSPPPSSTTSTTPHEVRTLNGMVPGQAVADGDGTALHTYGPDGREAGSVALGLNNVQAAASDLEGGWVACGGVNRPSPAEEITGAWSDEATGPTAQTRDTPTTAGGSTPTQIVSFPTMNWYPADGEPVNLGGDWGPSCYENGLQVVDSPEGPMALLGGLAMGGGGGGGGGPEVRLEAVLLATGEHRDLPVPPLSGLPAQWSATTGRVLTYVEGVGLQLWDLTDATALPMATIDPGPISELALSHDGRSAAVMHGTVEGPDEVVVYDLATGNEVFRTTLDMSIEGDQMSYDGTTLAVGSYSSGSVPVTVIDVATGAERTIDAHGVVL